MDKIITALCGTLFILSNCFAQTDSTSLIRYPVNPALSPEQERFAEPWKNSGYTEAWYYIEINPEVFEGDLLEVQLPGEKRLQIDKSVERPLSNGSRMWSGKPRSVDGCANFVISNGALTAEISTLEERFLIYPLSGSLHLLVRVSKNFPDDEPAEGYRKMLERSKAHAIDRGEDRNRNRPEGNRSAADVLPPTECRVRILIAVVDDVWDFLFDPPAYVALAIQNVNDVYIDSHIGFQVELARALRVAYEATGSLDTDLEAFQDLDDGQMDEVEYLKDYYDADLAVLITDEGDGCGLAYQIGAFSPDEAFCVVLSECALGNYSLAHELGHLYGCRHDPFADSDNTPYDFAHGFVHLAGNWRTVMAYNDFCEANGTNCTRIGHFSNPFVNFDGTPTGTLADNDNSFAHDVSAPEIVELETTLNTKQFQAEVIGPNQTADIISNIFVRNLDTYEIRSRAVVTWRTGSYLELRPGFWARSGARFRTTFTSCTPIDVDDIGDEIPVAFADIQDTLSTSIELKVNPDHISGRGAVQFRISESSVVTLDIFSPSQSLESRLIDEVFYEAGTHTVDFDAQNWRPGTFTFQLSTESEMQAVQEIKPK